VEEPPAEPAIDAIPVTTKRRACNTRRPARGYGRVVAGGIGRRTINRRRGFVSAGMLSLVEYERDHIHRERAARGGYTAEALGQSIFTVAETLEELNEMVRDAVMCHFEEESRPKIIRLHFVREELIAV